MVLPYIKMPQISGPKEFRFFKNSLGITRRFLLKLNVQSEKTRLDILGEVLSSTVDKLPIVGNNGLAEPLFHQKSVRHL